MSCPEFTGRSHSIGPIKFNMGTITHPHLLFEHADNATRFATVQKTGTFCLAKTIEDFNALPGCPKDFRFRFPVKKA